MEIPNLILFNIAWIQLRSATLIQQQDSKTQVCDIVFAEVSKSKPPLFDSNKGPRGYHPES